MTVQSGIIPYHYEGPVPFTFIYGQEVAFSGILLEQAQFVTLAERRRYSDPDASGFPFYIYINNAISRQNYEPTASGVIIPDVGCMSFIDYFSDIRDQLMSVFGKVSFDSDYDIHAIKKDWLIQAALSPSGSHGEFLYRIPTSNDLLPYLSTEIIGHSGILYDISLREVSYQPYTRMAAGRTIVIAGDPLFVEGSGSFGNAASVTSATNRLIRTSPIYPAFQKTNGGLITPTSRELNLFPPAFAELNDGTSNNHIVSGLVRIDGDVLHDTTNYMLATSGNNFANGFTHSADGIRKIGFKNASNARVYVTPSSQASGLYRIAVSTQLPYSIATSGQISIWPTEEDYLATGYNVFDYSIWGVDGTQHQDENSPPFFILASGLTLFSPYCGDPLYLRHASLRESNIAGDSATYNSVWGDFVGLERRSADSIYRARERVDLTDLGGGLSSPQKGNVHFLKYNDQLDFISDNFVFDQPIPFAIASGVPFTDFFINEGNSRIYLVQGQQTASDIFEFDTSFNFIQFYEGSTNKENIQKVAHLNSNFWIFKCDFSLLGNLVCPVGHLRRMELGTTVSPGSPTWGISAWGSIDLYNTKIINTDTLPGFSGQLVAPQNSGTIPITTIYDIINIPTKQGDGLNAGIWAIVAAGSGTPDVIYNNKINRWLIRIEEQATAWDVKEAINIGGGNGIGSSDILYMGY